MKRRCLVSMGIVIMLAGMSVMAFVNSFSEEPAEQVSDQREVLEPVVAIEPKTIIETIPIATEIVPTEESEESTYQSRIVSMDWDAEEAYLLAKIAMAEAESEDTEGKALVILVVLNRVWDDNFPDTIEDVIYQPDQFSPVGNGRFDEVEPDEDCWNALDMIVLDKWDESCGATYFESESESKWHSEHLDFLFQHGGHSFYRDKEE